MIIGDDDTNLCLSFTSFIHLSSPVIPLGCGTVKAFLDRAYSADPAFLPPGALALPILVIHNVLSVLLRLLQQSRFHHPLSQARAPIRSLGRRPVRTGLAHGARRWSVPR